MRSEEWRKYELSMCREQMENYYFMVIVWCLIPNCNDKILILSTGWIFDEWNRNHGWRDFGGGREYGGRSQVIQSGEQRRSVRMQTSNGIGEQIITFLYLKWT